MAVGRIRGAARVWRSAVAVAAAVVFAVAACGSPTPTPTPSPTPSINALTPSPVATTVPSTAPSAAAVAPSTAAVPSSAPYVAAPIGASGAVVLLEADGSLALIDAIDGERTVLAGPEAGSTGFAALSPDGGRIASVEAGDTASIIVFDLTTAPIESTVIFESPSVGPFYLSWTPDGRTVSYLANAGESIVLGLVPGDASTPQDGSTPGEVVGAGSPLYYDWIGSERMLAHVGTGPGALLAEIGLDGEIVGSTLGPAGDFRAAVVSPDQRRIGFVRQEAAGGSSVVMADRDGSDAWSVPVFGPAALAFDPTGVTLASIGATETPDEALGIPAGPLRLMEAGQTEPRTLLDGTVAGFWWSPDGATIAALRIEPLVPPAGTRTTEVRLLFVDVASGDVISGSVVRLGPLFVRQFIGFFDQYALSHELWAPDSSSFLLPVIDADGRSQVAVMHPDGRDPIVLDGQAAFWSP